MLAVTGYNINFFLIRCYFNVIKCMYYMYPDKSQKILVCDPAINCLGVGKYVSEMHDCASAPFDHTQLLNRSIDPSTLSAQGSLDLYT